MRRHRVLSALVGLLLVLGLPASLTPGAVSAPAAAAPGSDDRRIPGLKLRTLVGGLEIPWDVQQVGSRRFLVTERSRPRLSLVVDGRRRTVDFPRRSVWVRGETGLMSIAVDPRFGRTHRFWTCQGGRTAGGGHDVRVVAWRLRGRPLRARRDGVVLKGIQATSGRHGGCRLLLVGNRMMYVGTGDAAVGTNPRNRRSLNGKVLRLDARTGRPWPTNPWADAANRKKRYVLTFGHRNVQGLARRRDGTIWSVEHGTWRDDEVNRLRRGGDYGWHPVPGYNEQVPMTDHGLPGRQVGARWRSGEPTLATSGATWVHGRKWGRLRGTLAVAALKSNRLLFMKFSTAGELRWVRAPRATRQLGRLRSVTRTRANDLLVTTSNGSNDRVVRVSPRR
jgi:glucose/arabinose dehydrogenase